MLDSTFRIRVELEPPYGEEEIIYRNYQRPLCTNFLPFFQKRLRRMCVECRRCVESVHAFLSMFIYHSLCYRGVVYCDEIPENKEHKILL